MATYTRAELAKLAGILPQNITKGRAGAALAALEPRKGFQRYEYTEADAAAFLAALGKERDDGKS